MLETENLGHHGDMETEQELLKTQRSRDR